ncbi:hypothetical protein quinque_014667 [Culex quinquefasciatus]
MEQTGTNDGLEESFVTSVRKTEYRYAWVINNFSVWLENIEGKQCSPQFPAEHSAIVYEKMVKTPKPLPSSLAKDLKTLVGGDKFSDVTILVAGQRFPAHKCILSARSSVFSAMFEHPMQETIENCVSIDDVEPPVIEALLGFIYTDELTSLETMAHALYKAADKYDVPTLKSICRCHILEKLSSETVAETLMLADLYGDLEMKKHVLQFLSVSVVVKVTETDGWKEMVRACPHLVDETIRAMAAKESWKE